MLASRPRRIWRAARRPAGVSRNAAERWSAPRRRSTRPSATKRSTSRTVPEWERLTTRARASIEPPADGPCSATSAAADELLPADSIASASQSERTAASAPRRFAARPDVCMTHAYQRWRRETPRASIVPGPRRAAVSAPPRRRYHARSRPASGETAAIARDRPKSRGWRPGGEATAPTRNSHRRLGTTLDHGLSLDILDRRSQPARPKEEIRTKRDSGPYSPAMSRPRQILALGGGGFSMEAGNALLDDHALALTGVECPKVCFLPTASGDADHYIVRFYRAFPAGRCQPSHISLFRRDGGATDLAAHLMSQDLVYVGGGSLISLLGTWTAHGIDLMLRAAWQDGVVMAGLSAGSLCWFEDAITAFHGQSRRVKGMGLLPHSNAVHYEDEPERRAAYLAAIADGMPPGYGTGDGAALHFVDTSLARVVTSRPHARAYHVASDGGDVIETELATHFLGTPVAVEPALAA